MNDDDKVDGRINGPQIEPEVRDKLIMRLIYVIIIAFMISVAQTILTALTLVQFVIMVLHSGTPNERLADFGTTLGVWIAKAARYQTADSEVKPWPWTELD